MLNPPHVVEIHQCSGSFLVISRRMFHHQTLAAKENEFDLTDPPTYQHRNVHQACRLSKVLRIAMCDLSVHFQMRCHGNAQIILEHPAMDSLTVGYQEFLAEGQSCSVHQGMYQE